MRREDYCDPQNREIIAKDYPFMLDYFDSYCSSEPACILESKQEQGQDPTNAKNTTNTANTANTTNIDMIWIVAVIMFIIIIALGMMML
jgi:hypothetical protein